MQTVKVPEHKPPHNNHTPDAFQSQAQPPTSRHTTIPHRHIPTRPEHQIPLTPQSFHTTALLHNPTIPRSHSPIPPQGTTYSNTYAIIRTLPTHSHTVQLNLPHSTHAHSHTLAVTPTTPSCTHCMQIICGIYNICYKGVKCGGIILDSTLMGGALLSMSPCV